MEYKGKLYGKIGNKYFDTGHDADEWDEVQRRIVELEVRIKQFDLADVSGTLICPSCESTDIDTEFNHYNLCRNCNMDWAK